MAKSNSGSKTPASGGGNHRTPAQKVGLGGVVPTTYNPSYGSNVGVGGQGGPAVPAKNGGNNTTFPKLGGQPTSYPNDTNLK